MPKSHPPESFSDRLLLHRSNSHFFILGTTGNVYTVKLSSNPTCTCPDVAIPCKHILFVYIHVLSLPPHDPCLQRKTLRPCKLTRLLSAPTASETLAGEAIRRRFHEMYKRKKDKKACATTVKYGSTCPVCLEEMMDGRRVVACATCKNPIHVKCLMTWKSKGLRTCVICRATWRGIGDEDKYINLSAYVSHDDDRVVHISQGQDNWVY